ncbi:MAG: hypothetical protein V1850_01140 [Candidatus Bathyarchaeota archaeon]
MLKLTTRQIALTSVFAGFYYLFSFLPGIPAPGITGIQIQVAACMATVFGYILGPFLGATATFLGVSVAWLLPPGNMSLSALLFVPSPVINAVTSGFLFQRRWKAAAASLGLLIFVFWLTPPIQPVTEFWNVGIAVTFDKIIALLLIWPIILLDKMIRKDNSDGVQQSTLKPKSWFVPLLAVISSLLVVGNSLLVAMAGKPPTFQYGDLGITFGYEGIINAMGSLNYVWVVVGLVSLFASIMLWFRPEKRRVWATMLISCALASVITGGGFIIGIVVAVIAGFFAFFESVASHQALPRLEVLSLFIMAFIGNEADNMWGSLIFSVPFVYTTIFPLDVGVVRFLFILSPFAYPAIRFLQAIVATIIAAPLLRTLRAAKFIPNARDRS